ncbi:MAG: hypothetical protein ACK4UO_07820 [Pseudolabrys sp.]
MQKEYTGTLLITDKEITADLFAYEARYIEIDDDQPVHLQTQHLNVVSLHSNLPASTGTAFRASDDLRLRGLYHTKISSYVAVVGPSPWLSTDELKTASFRLPEAEFILRHLEKVERVLQEELGSGADTELFSVTVASMTIKCHYGMSYQRLKPIPDRLTIWITIDFDVPHTLRSYLPDVIAVEQLFALSAGFPLTPAELVISRHTTDDMRALMDQGQYSAGHHDIHYLWPEIKADRDRAWIGSSFIAATDDVELDGLKSCLAAWMERRQAWKKANGLMSTTLMLQTEISPNRFLNACRWFEEIPIVGTEQAISTADIEAISNVASSRAAELGYARLCDRIRGALKRIAMESQRSRFERLLKSVRVRFGVGTFEDEVVDDLLRAMALRGKAAHGHIGAENKHEHLLFVRSLFALEAFCFFLTVRDLLMSAEGTKRALGNPLVENYRHCPTVSVSAD